jgi:hypothetical protein
VHSIYKICSDSIYVHTDVMDMEMYAVRGKLKTCKIEFLSDVCVTVQMKE